MYTYFKNILNHLEYKLIKYFLRIKIYYGKLKIV